MHLLLRLAVMVEGHCGDQIDVVQQVTGAVFERELTENVRSDLGESVQPVWQCDGLDFEGFVEGRVSRTSALRVYLLNDTVLHVLIAFDCHVTNSEIDVVKS
jgi:hypothetical protein